MAQLTVQQQMELIDFYFDVLHKEIAKDDWNLEKIGEFLRTYTDIGHLNKEAIDFAVAQLAGQLHYLAHVDVSAQLAAGAQAQKELDASNRAAKEERKRIEKENLREQLQFNRKPGFSSAYSGMEDDTAQRQQEAAKIQKEAIRAQEHAAFLAELREANQFIDSLPNGMIKWGSTNEKRTAMRQDLKRRYPKFASEIQ